MEVKFVNRFPILETPRLILRGLNSDDAEFIHFMRNDTRVNALVERPKTDNINDARFFIEQRNQDFFYKKALYWGLEMKTNGFLIGTITIWHLDLEEKSGELGYDMHPDFQGRGFMTEAVSEVLNFCFHRLLLKEITAITNPLNEASLRLLSKFQFEAMDLGDISEIDREAGLIGYRLIQETTD